MGSPGAWTSRWSRSTATWTGSGCPASDSTRAGRRSGPLSLDGGADSAQLDVITHPSIVTGPDFYRRLDREWRARCAAVPCIEPAAWERTSEPSEEANSVTNQDQAATPRVPDGAARPVQVTAPVTAYGSAMKNPSHSDEMAGAKW